MVIKCKEPAVQYHGGHWTFCFLCRCSSFSNNCVSALTVTSKFFIVSAYLRLHCSILLNQRKWVIYKFCIYARSATSIPMLAVVSPYFSEWSHKYNYCLYPFHGTRVLEETDVVRSWIKLVHRVNKPDRRNQTRCPSAAESVYLGAT